MVIAAYISIIITCIGSGILGLFFGFTFNPHASRHFLNGRGGTNGAGILVLYFMIICGVGITTWLLSVFFAYRLTEIDVWKARSAYLYCAAPLITALMGYAIFAFKV